MSTKEIYISDKVDFTQMLSPRIYEKLRGINTKTLEERKHNFLLIRYNYEINRGYITVKGVEPCDIDLVSKVINF